MAMNAQIVAQKVDIDFGQPRAMLPGRARTEGAVHHLRPAGDSEAQMRVRHEAALADLGALALGGGDVADVVRASVSILEALLDMDLVLVMRRQPHQNALSLEDGSHADGYLSPGVVIPAEEGSQVDRALHSSTPIVVHNVDFDKRSQSLLQLPEHRVSSGVLTPIQGESAPWGVLAAYSASRDALADEDLHFVRAVSNAIASAIAYSRAQRTIENLIEDSPDPIIRFDPELRIEYANMALLLATGYPAEELLGQTIRALRLMESQLDGLETLLRTVFRSRRQREATFSLSSPLGERSYHVRFVPELATDGSVTSVLAIARDVTEFKKVDDERASLQQELLERDRRHEDLVHQLLGEQQRTTEQGADANYRAEIVKQLTERETEILRLVAAGLTNRQIARRLRLSAGTVRNYLGRVFPKVDAVDRTQAAVRAVELGLIVPHEW